MKGFSALFRKEWRDHRALLLAAAVFGPLLVWGSQALQGVVVADEVVGAWLLPGFVGLLLAALAADVVASEVPRGIGRTMTRLPVPVWSLLATKLAFLVAVWAGFQAWLVGFEMLRRAVTGQGVAVLVTSYIDSTGVHALVLVTTVSALAFAAVLQRSLHAAIAGVLFIAAPGAIVPGLGRPDQAPWLDRLELALSPFSGSTFLALAAFALVVGAFVVAAFASYSPSTDARPSWARALRGAAGFGALVLPLVGVSAVVVARKLDVVPYGANAYMGRIAPSPDGRSIALEAHGPPLTRRGHSRTCEVWLIDVAKGDLVEVEGNANELFYYQWRERVWDDGRLMVRSRPSPFTRDHSSLLFVDAATGSVVEERSEEILAQDARVVLQGGWMRARHTERDKRRDDGLREYTVTWPGENLTLGVESRRRPIASPEPGVILYAGAAGTVFRRDLREESPAPIATYEGDAWVRELSPGGSAFLIHDESGLRVLDAEDGSPLFGPTEDFRFVEWSRRSGEVCLLRSTDHRSVVRLVRRDGSREISIGDGRHLRDICTIAPSGYVATTMYETVELFDSQGAWKRTLYEPEEGDR